MQKQSGSRDISRKGSAMDRGATGRVMVAEPQVTETRPVVLDRPTPQPLEWSGVLAQKGYVFGADISGDGECVVLADLSGNVIGRSEEAHSRTGVDTGMAPGQVV